jgi:uncharacterized RDD family membrane protein YckC
MEPIAGWYDDPRDESGLRYWDGTAWTDDVTPKQPSATDTPQWNYPAAPPAQAQTWNYGAPTQEQAQQSQPQAPPPAQHQQQQQQQQQHEQLPQQQLPPQASGYQYPYQQQQPQQTGPPAPQYPYPYPQQPQQPWPPAPGMAPYRLSTPDGVPITSWGKRLAARLLDALFVAIGGLPFTGYFYYQFFQALSDQLDANRSAFNPTSEVVRWELAAAAMSIVLGALYETFCLRHWSATAGKRILEIQVRSYDGEGPLSWPTILRRVGFMYGLSVLGLVPVASLFAGLMALLDYLWPLWDKKRQALHDRAAGTVVVERPRQPSYQPMS